jgi:hypothetical protein
MTLIRKFAVQGHPVPNGYQRRLGPFPPEILAQSKVVYEHETPDSLHEALDNVRMFRCRDCSEILYEDELDSHDCDDDYEEEEEE